MWRRCRSCPSLDSCTNYCQTEFAHDRPLDTLQSFLSLHTASPNPHTLLATPICRLVDFSHYSLSFLPGTANSRPIVLYSYTDFSCGSHIHQPISRTAILSYPDGRAQPHDKFAAFVPFKGLIPNPLLAHCQ